MPRPTPIERARLYVSRMPPAESGAGGHSATFAAAMVLLQGFDLPRSDARAILDEFNARCLPPWSDRELEHKLNQADKQSGFTTAEGLQPRGCLRDDGGEDSREQTAASAPARQQPPAPAKPAFDLATLKRAAGDLTQTVDLIWLANRSAQDPALVTSQRYLSSLYEPSERVLVFTNDKTQGEALWPAQKMPSTGPLGVWYLCQPVDGQRHPNPRTTPPKMSRRSEESVTAWRFLVLESDQAPMREWLAVLAQLPLRIAAIYTSGGRSIHALVRVDCTTKAEWDQEKHKMKAGLVILGADPGAMSAVRLTRLPGCFRQGAYIKGHDGKPRYAAYKEPRLQKLLYLNPLAPDRPLVDMLARRDVETDWLRLANSGASPALARGLAYYARLSPRLLQAYSTLNSQTAST